MRLHQLGRTGFTCIVKRLKVIANDYDRTALFTQRQDAHPTIVYSLRY